MDPSFQVARILYFTDVTREGAAVIPIGAFAECLTEKVHGLALTARTSLSKTELASVPTFMRAALADPFSFLRAQFDAAWEHAEPGRALEYLSKRNSGALSIMAASDCVEKAWFSTRLIHPRDEVVDEKLLEAVKREYEGMLNADVPQRLIIESQRRAAAA